MLTKQISFVELKTWQKIGLLLFATIPMVFVVSYGWMIVDNIKPAVLAGVDISSSTTVLFDELSSNSSTTLFNSTAILVNDQQYAYSGQQSLLFSFPDKWHFKATYYNQNTVNMNSGDSLEFYIRSSNGYFNTSGTPKALGVILNYTGPNDESDYIDITSQFAGGIVTEQYQKITIPRELIGGKFIGKFHKIYLVASSTLLSKGASFYVDSVVIRRANTSFSEIIDLSPADTIMTVNANQVIGDIWPTVIGGEEWNSYSSALWSLYYNFKDSGLAKGSWTVHPGDDSTGQRWDSNLIESRSVNAGYCRNGLDGCSQTKYFVTPDGFYNQASGAIGKEVVDYDKGNKVTVDYWNGTDMSHSGVVVKTNKAANAYVRLATNIVKATNPAYARLDVKIDSSQPFQATSSGWILMTAGQAGGGTDFVVRLTNDRRFDVRAINSSGKETKLALSSAMELDKYYSLEVYYGSGECAYWVNGNQIDRQKLTTRTNLGWLNFGSVGSAIEGVQGKIHVDALRVDSQYIGNNVLLPWEHDYSTSFTFDNNLRTIDDIAGIAEKLGTTIVWGIPLPNKTRPGYIENSDGNGWDWQTLQYYTDMVEYLNGVADSDYLVKANNLDWNHQTPSDNWANLRAARGRVQPYNQLYFEIGVEPYYGGGWRYTDPITKKVVENIDGYAKEVIKYSQKFKEVNGNIKIGIISFKNGGSNDWYDRILPVAGNYINFVSLYHDYPYPNSVSTPREHWLGIPIADNNKYIYGAANKKDWVNPPYGSSNPTIGADKFFYSPYYARYKINQFLFGRNIDLSMTEYGYFVQPGYGEDNWLGSAINRASWLEALIKGGVRFAGSWLMTSERFGNSFLVFHSPYFANNSSIEKTPSYYVYKIIADHLGSKLLKTDTINTFSPYRFGAVDSSASGFDIPYVSGWSSINSSRDKIFITFINRNQTTSTSVAVKFNGFLANPTVKVFSVSGDNICSDNEVTNEGTRLTGWCPASDNNNNPYNIVENKRDISISGNVIRYTLPKLSVTVFEVSGKAQ